MNKLSIKIIASELDQFTELKNLTTALDFTFMDQFETVDKSFHIKLHSKPIYDKKGILVIGDVRSIQEDTGRETVYSSVYKKYTVLTDITLIDKPIFVVLEFLILENQPLIVQFQTKNYLSKK